MCGIKELAYQLYIIDWERRISADRKMDAMKNWYQETDPEDRKDYPFEEYLEEVGYEGELFVCFDEFMDNEFLDEAYMKELLNNDDLYEEYKAYVAELEDEEDE